VFLARESRALLVGEAADPEVVEGIRALAEAHPDVRRVGDPLTMHLGPDEVLVNLSLRFRSGLPNDQVANAVARLEEAVRRQHPEVTRIFVEAGTPASRKTQKAN
jgi:divalent metal cation (Fe/Co/Zn/Cd) transporter